MDETVPATAPLIVGPRPPPVGGIATIVAGLAVWPGVASSVQFLDTTKRDGGGRLARIARPLRLLRELSRRMRKRPECALCFSSAFGSFWEKGMWLALSRWRGVPMAVMMVDGNFPKFYESLSPAKQALARALLVRFSSVIVQTESWRRFYSQIAPRGNYVVLPNGVDCIEFAPVARTPAAVPVLLFVGWTIPEKGVFDLVEAAAMLRRRGCEFRLKIVGPFHGQEQSLKSAVASGGVEDVTDVAGPVHSRAALLDIYRQADVYVLPSWAEGLPVAMLEAMACGLPVVATSVGGVPDLVEEGKSGLLVPARNVEALADALQSIVTNGPMRAGMAAAARQRVESAFSTTQFIVGLLALLRSRGRAPK